MNVGSIVELAPAQAGKTVRRPVGETAVKEAAPPRLSYMVIDLAGAPADEIQTELNKLAGDGWSLIYVGDGLHYLAKVAAPDRYASRKVADLRVAIDEAWESAGKVDG